ncbi:MAG: PAS domain S-box protein [Spirochaetales bacterium]|nr:MAG: PAS domain S-box protein [Spirochaetales bacterium]
MAYSRARAYNWRVGPEPAGDSSAVMMKASRTLSRKWPIAISITIIVVGLTLSTLLYLRVEAIWQDTQDEAFRFDALHLANLVLTNVRNCFDHIDSLKAFYENSEYVSDLEFQHFTHPWFEKHEFEILAFLDQALPSAGNEPLVPRLVRPDDEQTRFQVEQLIASPEFNELTQQAMDTGQLVMSGFISGSGVVRGPGVLLCTALADPDGDGTQSSFAIAFLSVEEVVGSSLHDSMSQGIEVRLRDAADPDSAPGFSYPTPSFQDADGDYPLFMSVARLAGREWLFEAQPGQDYLQPGEQDSLLILIACIIASISFGLLLGILLDGKRRLEALTVAKSEEYERFFIASQDLFAILDGEGHFMKLNPHWEAVLGIPPAQLAGVSLSDLAHPHDREATEQFLQDVHSGNRISSFTNRCLSASGTYRLIEWRSAMSPDDQTIFVAADDITERQAMERELRDSLNEKDVLLREVHHRVKNNMQIISSLLDLQADNDHVEEFSAAVREAQGRIRSMATIHEQLYEQGNFSAIDLARYAREIASALTRDFARGPVRLTVDVQDVLLPLDTAIPCGLIINELVTNSLKYGVRIDGSVSIGISAMRRDGYCTLVVEDDGPGLPAGIFDSPDSRSTLGISLITTLAEQVGGTVSAPQGLGARVELTFPMTDGANSAGS